MTFPNVKRIDLFLFLTVFLALVFSSDTKAEENNVSSNIEIDNKWYNIEQEFVWQINGTYNGTLEIYYAFNEEESFDNVKWILYDILTIKNVSVPNDELKKGNFTFDFPSGSGFYKIESNFTVDNGTSEFESFNQFTGDGLKFDNEVPLIAFNSLILKLKNESDSSISWNGTGDIYDSTYWSKDGEIDSALLKNLTLDYRIIDKHSGIRASHIQYSEDNFASWVEYDILDVIELNFSTLYIRIAVIDNAGNYVQYREEPIDVENLPVEASLAVDDSINTIADIDDSNDNLIFIVVIIVSGAFAFYKYKQGKFLEKKDNTISSERSECPKCNVLVPKGSISCNFCGEVWGNNNEILTNPFSEVAIKKQKEIVPRVGEILIDSNTERWKIEVGARSCIGGRKNNEDSICWNTFLKITNGVPSSIKLGIVADGVGGHNKGEIASSMLISAFNQAISKSIDEQLNINTFTKEDHKNTLEKAYHTANNDIFEKAQEKNYSGMATTAVSVYIWEDANKNNGFLIGNVGDSRGYLINKKEIIQATKDDSEVQKLIDNGEITNEEAKNHPRKNVITQAIGNKKNIIPKIETYNLHNFDYEYILLCSDGISDKMNEKELHKIINQFSNPQDACDRIVKIINRTNSNHDNNSLILIKFPNLLSGDIE